MKNKELNKLIDHLQFYFHQEIKKIYVSDEQSELNIEFLLFEPNEDYPFYKVVTAGASDYQMPESNGSLPNRNEYMIFLSEDFDISSNEFNLYLSFLNYVATYAYYEKTNVTVGHSFSIDQFKIRDFVGAQIMFPQILVDSYVLRCKLGMFKTIACLQVMTLTKQELDELFKIGPMLMEEKFYPAEGESIFLADRNTNN